jgi:hypothetical protein
MRQIDIPLVLSFRYSQVQEFVMYTGSRRGAVTCDTADMKPYELWSDEIEEKENLYKEMGLVFIDDTRLRIMPHNYFYKYRLKGGIIEVLISEYDEWVPFAYGDRNKLTIRLGLTGIVDLRGMDKKRSLNRDETCWSAFNYAGLPTLSLLKDKKAKIAWCNIHYTFQ